MARGATGTADPRLAAIAQRIARTGGVPKYRALYDALLGAIEAGQWKPGDRLPSELVITDAVPVSLGTVQRALQDLVDSGVVTRRHGQGSFVAIRPVTESQIRNFRFLADDGERLLPVYGRVLSVEATEESGAWSRFLSPEARFVRIARLVSVNLEFQAYSEVYLPATRFGEFLEIPAAQISMPLTHVLHERFNAPTLNVTHTLSCEPVPAGAADAIGLEPGTVGLLWEIFSHTYRRAPSFYQRVRLPLTSRKLLIPDGG